MTAEEDIADLEMMVKQYQEGLLHKVDACIIAPPILEGVTKS